MNNECLHSSDGYVRHPSSAVRRLSSKIHPDPECLIIAAVDKRYRMLIDALDGSPRDVRRLLRPVPHSRAVHPLAAGASLLDVVAELVAYEAPVRELAERILAEEHPTLVEATPARAAFGDTEAAIAAFAHERARTTALLEPLTQAQWLRTALLVDAGPLRLRTLVERLVAHDNALLARIVDMRESVDRLP